MNSPNNDCVIITGVEYAEMRKNDFDILEIINNQDNTVNIIFESGRDWKTIPSDHLSFSFSEQDKTTDAGNSVFSKLSMLRHGDDANFRKEITQLKQVPLIIKINYSNGKSKIIGNMQNFSRIKQAKTDKNFLIENEFILTITDKETAYFLE